MTFQNVLLAALLATTATVGLANAAVTTPATPAVAVAPVDGAKQLAAADSVTGRTALYPVLIGTNFAAADPLMAEVAKLCTGAAGQLEGALCDAAEGSTILKEILAYLKQAGASDELISSLADKYATQLAFVPGDVEPAAGPEEGFGGEDFGTDDGNGNETLENPNQLSGNQAPAQQEAPPEILD
jgi:hypothetical protein